MSAIDAIIQLLKKVMFRNFDWHWALQVNVFSIEKKYNLTLESCAKGLLTCFKGVLQGVQTADIIEYYFWTSSHLNGLLKPKFDY